jgi:hypothetical protein
LGAIRALRKPFKLEALLEDNFRLSCSGKADIVVARAGSRRRARLLTPKEARDGTFAERPNQLLARHRNEEKAAQER